jgi:hypothetical protein
MRQLAANRTTVQLGMPNSRPPAGRSNPAHD